MALATTEDVKRYIPGTAADADLTPLLEAAEAWTKRVTGRAWDASGEQTETFWDVRDGDVITLRDENPTGVSVVIGDATLIEDSDYHLMSGGKIRLIFVRYGSPAGLPGAVVEVLPHTFAVVEVTYTASETVPAPVREAVAMVAACTYLDSQSAGSLLSERLGDYSYSREPEGSKLAIPSRAAAYLQPYNKRLRVRST